MSKQRFIWIAKSLWFEQVPGPAVPLEHSVIDHMSKIFQVHQFSSA